VGFDSFGVVRREPLPRQLQVVVGLQVQPELRAIGRRPGSGPSPGALRRSLGAPGKWLETLVSKTLRREQRGLAPSLFKYERVSSRTDR
jgi:hypothetical protein